VSTPSRRVGAVVFAASVGLSTSGCASGHEDAAGATADAFYRALADDQGKAACDLLAPETRSELEQSSRQPCDEAILDEGVTDSGARRDTKVFGTMAEVRYVHDTAFLAEFEHGWKVMATACTQMPVAQRYDCSVKGG
jgi:hypothetical protein